MAAEVSDSMETSEESETTGGADSMLFIVLVEVNICGEGMKAKANDDDAESTRSLAVAAATKQEVVFIIMIQCIERPE